MRNGEKKNIILLIIVILISVGILFLFWKYIIYRMLQAMFGFQWQIM